MRKPIATILAGFIALFAFNPSADAAPADGKRPVVRPVCETGYRGQPAYDRACLVNGTFKAGANLWLSVPNGKKGQERDGAYNRRSVCKFAGRYGGTRAIARDLFADVAYDRYRNYRYVLNASAYVAVGDCKAMGYKIVK